MGYQVKAYSKIFCLSGNPPLGVTVLGSARAFAWLRPLLSVPAKTSRYSDEAHFHLDWKVNSQNLRLQSHGKSDVVVEVLFYLVKNKIWCMSNRGVKCHECTSLYFCTMYFVRMFVRMYFFECNVGDTQTVNDQRRRTVLGKF